MSIENKNLKQDPSRPPPGGWKLGKHSFTKMKTYQDGRVLDSRYSYDWKGSNSPGRDQAQGINRLLKFGQDKFPNADNYLFLDNQEDRKLLVINKKGAIKWFD